MNMRQGILESKIFHTENHGLSAARNLGLEYARKNGSEYVGFVDSDNWIEPDMFEVLYAAATKYHADVVECGVYSEVPDKTEVFSRCAPHYSCGKFK